MTIKHIHHVYVHKEDTSFETKVLELLENILSNQSSEQTINEQADKLDKSTNQLKNEIDKNKDSLT